MTAERVEVFPNEPGSISQARYAANALLAEHGITDTFTIELLVSELLTNAVHHGDGPIELRLHVDGDRIRVTVTDQGAREPVLHEPDLDTPAAGELGLHMVDATADTWGADTDETRTTVWFDLELDP